jgi:hypothetical protein
MSTSIGVGVIPRGALYYRERKGLSMFKKLLRSTVFIGLVKWALPRIIAYIRKRHAANSVKR